MGRLRKSVVDKIKRLRNQGYTQAETAEKTGVHLKTVQKHDPLRQSKSRDNSKTSAVPATFDEERYMKCVGDWIETIVIALLEMRQGLICPKCYSGKLALDDSTETYLCNRCKYEMIIPTHLWDEKNKN